MGGCLVGRGICYGENILTDLDEIPRIGRKGKIIQGTTVWKWECCKSPCGYTGLLRDAQNCGLRMRRECWERFLSNRRLAIPTCITHVRDARALIHAGIANLRFPLKSVAGKTFPAFPAHVQLAILRIWQDVHGVCFSVFIWNEGRVIGGGLTVSNIKVKIKNGFWCFGQYIW